MEGEVKVWHGDGLTEQVTLAPGDYIYIPPSTPHLPVNRQDQDMIAIVARTDPDEQEGVHLLDLPTTWRPRSPEYRPRPRDEPTARRGGSAFGRQTSVKSAPPASVPPEVSAPERSVAAE